MNDQQFEEFLALQRLTWPQLNALIDGADHVYADLKPEYERIKALYAQAQANRARLRLARDNKRLNEAATRTGGTTDV